MEEHTIPQCPCVECIVQASCSVISDCPKWFSFFLEITKILGSTIHEDNLEGVNSLNMKTVRDLMEKFQEFENSLMNLENNYEELEGRITDIEQSDIKCSDEVKDAIKDEVETQVNDKFYELEDRVNDIERDQQDFNGLEEKVNELEAQVSDINIEDIDNRVEDLDNRLDDVERNMGDVGDVETKTQELQETIDNKILKEVVAMKQAATSLVEIQGRFLDLETRVDDINNLVTLNKKEIQ